MLNGTNISSPKLPTEVRRSRQWSRGIAMIVVCTAGALGFAASASVPVVAATKKGASKAPNGALATGSSKAAPSESVGVPAPNSRLVPLSPPVTPQPIPQPVPQPTTSTPNTVPAAKAYTENFTDPLAWALFADPTSIVAISAAADNPMMLFSQTGTQTLYGYIASFSPSNSDISLRATVVNGSKTYAVGTFCRRKGATSYEFQISNGGLYAIFRLDEKTFTYLTGDGKWLADPSIPSSFTSIDIGSSCRGNQLSLLVNGKVIATVIDNTYTDGRTGAMVQNYAPTELRAYVDDVKFTY